MKASTYGALLGILLIKILAFNFAIADYQIGIGRADCTGPSVEITFMGYAKMQQVGCGLHLRQFSRAYIVDDGENRAAFVTVDAQSMPHGVRREVLKELRVLYNDTYTEQNFILSGTHTHSTPGGFMQDLMYDIPNLGYVRESFDALIEGVVQSVVNAHENMVEGKIFLNSGELLDANINRSPASYLQNPDEERTKYEYNVDKDMVQLKFVRSSDNTPIGAINWFAVHPTSMNNSNCLLSSDNVGYASILLESHVNNGSLPGQGQFIGAFASTNLGDVSPNTKGPICIDTGEECDFLTSTCNGVSSTCIAFGPGKDMVESTKIIAEKLFGKAQELFHEEGTFEVNGPVKFIHQYVDMPNERVNITLYNGTQIEAKGCRPGLGYSFAAGTTDGPGEFNFEQGNVTDNPFWDAVRDVLFPPTEEDIECHYPKPIIVFPGGITFPYQWIPQIVSTQIVTIGEIALIAVPGEFTTMSGRRVRDAVKEVIINNGGSEDTRPILTGLSNTYSSYIATPEEYQVQRYEGGSTIYGPHTLDIYIQKYKELANALMQGEQLEEGPTPGDFTSQLITLVFGPGQDSVTNGNDFGDCIQQPPETITAGDTVVVKFAAGNPRHNLLHGDSYLSVEKQVDKEDWITVATDANWNTRFRWAKTNIFTGESEATIEWDIDENVEKGTYRIRHKGSHKNSDDEITPYEGVSDTFSVA